MLERLERLTKPLYKANHAVFDALGTRRAYIIFLLSAVAFCFIMGIGTHGEVAVFLVILMILCAALGEIILMFFALVVKIVTAPFSLTYRLCEKRLAKRCYDANTSQNTNFNWYEEPNVGIRYFIEQEKEKKAYNAKYLG